MDDIMITKASPNKGRKRIADSSKWKREKAKVKRHSAKNLPSYPSCKHNGKPGQPYHCCNKNIVSLQTIKQFHENFYASKNKIDQDNFILRFCTSSFPKRSKKDNNRKPKNVSIKYNIRRMEDGSLVAICRDAFLKVLDISKDRVINVVKRHLLTGQSPKERRGGDRIGNKNNEKRRKVTEFIESLTCTESHYSRSKNMFRTYLPCELNIKKLWCMFNEIQEEEHKVKQCFFRKIFTTTYNIGFGSPKTDICSTCTQFEEKMKCNLDKPAKLELMALQRVHKLRAKAFYELLKESKENVETFSFDCEKNLALPKLPDQACYFSMQLNLYNFTIINGPSNTALNPTTATAFLWSEVDRPKSSNEISSAVFHKLSNFSFRKDIKIVRLVADGCSGQNKNSTMVGMAMFWLQHLAPQHIREVHIMFPVVGHSFIPPDRVFGFIEKNVKKTSCIVSPMDMST